MSLFSGTPPEVSLRLFLSEQNRSCVRPREALSFEWLSTDFVSTELTFVRKQTLKVVVEKVSLSMVIKQGLVGPNCGGNSVLQAYEQLRKTGKGLRLKVLNHVLRIVT
jgi:hypothetical protein